MSTSPAEASEPPFRAAIIPVTAFQQNCALIWETASRRGAVVDPGGDVERILRVIAEADVAVEKILVTHGHVDHIGGVTALRDRLVAMNATAVVIEGPHRADQPIIDGLETSARKFGIVDALPMQPDRWLEQGDTVSVGDIVFEVLHCPGHSPGSVVYFQREVGFAFVGDVIFQNSVGRTDLFGGSHTQLIASICDKLLPLGDDVAFLPGHGAMSTIGEERRNNPYLVPVA
ncbi:MAG: MBL fold metallo-hydrolase [Ancalomicrobiaceae bacterium]|nr:MBL fold metallo-hydrolase [Ancalomicrobiaceae bacterium]